MNAAFYHIFCTCDKGKLLVLYCPSSGTRTMRENTAFAVRSLRVHCAFTVRSLCLEIGAHMGGQRHSKWRARTFACKARACAVFASPTQHSAHQHAHVCFSPPAKTNMHMYAHGRHHAQQLDDGRNDDTTAPQQGPPPHYPNLKTGDGSSDDIHHHPPCAAVSKRHKFFYQDH